MKQVCAACGEKKEVKPYIPDTIDSDIVVAEMLCDECLQKRTR